MKVALFIPCYIEQFYPQVGIATLELLEKLGCEVVYPQGQTCCGQPLANSGMEKEALPIYEHFVDTFQENEYIVAPSGSCTYHVRHHYDTMHQTKEVSNVRNRTYDLVEFLVDILKIEKLDAYFPHKVGLHQSCHGLRGLRLGSPSETMEVGFSKINYLLDMVKGLERVPLERVDECCGFGGTFAINEATVSVKMGKDKIFDHQKNQAEFITAGDMSCLMHLDGIIKREKSPIGIRHIAEILNGG
ncbi:MAG TPA: (Fe-S)-binding protein [Phaeodactylibacter sp.]|nr:(Fe-S)-binding protein [Phaeodactylibacter sp.]